MVYDILLYFTVFFLYCFVSYSTLLHCTELNCILLYWAVLFCTVIHYTIFYHITQLIKIKYSLIPSCLPIGPLYPAFHQYDDYKSLYNWFLCLSACLVSFLCLKHFFSNFQLPVSQPLEELQELDLEYKLITLKSITG